MGQMITITMADGFGLEAYSSSPTGGDSKGVIVVIQEIFGVNAHIREVVDGYAAEGIRRLHQLCLIASNRTFNWAMATPTWARVSILHFRSCKCRRHLADLQSVVNYAGERGAVGVVGYCFGGLLTYLSACNVKGVTAASSYYGGGIASVLSNAEVSADYAFGELDAHIPMADVEKIQRHIRSACLRVRR